MTTLQNRLQQLAQAGEPLDTEAFQQASEWLLFSTTPLPQLSLTAEGEVMAEWSNTETLVSVTFKRGGKKALCTGVSGNSRELYDFSCTLDTVISAQEMVTFVLGCLETDQ